jgi:hypothetical protein
MIYRLRASHWLLKHPDASTELRSQIKERAPGRVLQ